jgi:indole-3-glycerol phosphate synthase
MARANEMGMDCLVEVHDQAELDVALNVGARVIGINNRNLKTLQTSLETTEHLAPMVPRDRTVVSESGISSKAEVARLAAYGVHAILVGTHLMRHADPGVALAELTGVPRQ